MPVLQVFQVSGPSSSSKKYRHVSTQWLLSGHMSAQYVLCGHISAQYVLCGQFCWFPHPLDHS